MRVHLPEGAETLGTVLKELLEVCFDDASGAVTISRGQPLSHQRIRHRLVARLGISDLWRQARGCRPHWEHTDIGQNAHLPQDRQQRPMSRRWCLVFPVHQTKELAPQVGWRL